MTSPLILVLFALVDPFDLSLHIPVLEEKPESGEFLYLHSAFCPGCVRPARCKWDLIVVELVAHQVENPLLVVQVPGNLKLFAFVLIVEMLLQSLDYQVSRGWQNVKLILVQWILSVLEFEQPRKALPDAGEEPWRYLQRPLRWKDLVGLLA